jgi:hypothetical protein
MTPINSLSLSLSFFFFKSCNDFEIIPNKEKSGGRDRERKRLPLSGGGAHPLRQLCRQLSPLARRCAIQKIPEALPEL